MSLATGHVATCLQGARVLRACERTPDDRPIARVKKADGLPKSSYRLISASSISR